MSEKIVLVTGSLAEPRLQRLSNELDNKETEITDSNVGVKVAALMTTKIVERRLTLPEGTNRVIMPGRFRGDLERLSDFFGTRFERGPDELADLPEYLGRARKAVGLSRYDVLIFAEIVDESLSEATIDIVDEGPAEPILVSAGAADMESLDRAIEKMIEKGRPYYADPILDPIHYGFAESIARYVDLRRRRPDAPILMGIGNVTELTDADTTGINALLMGLVSELHITAVLAVQVSPHCRTAIREFDRARREYFAAREAKALPQGFGSGLMALRDRRPYATTSKDIAALATEVRDPNYRIEVAEDGIHIYNRDGHHISDDLFELFPKIDARQDVGHAFYLGVETARAEIAFRLGKRYVQDEPLSFGVVTTIKAAADEAHKLSFKESGTTRSKVSEKET